MADFEAKAPKGLSAAPGDEAEESHPAAHDPDWQRAWIETLQTPWDSLTVVPAEASIDADAVAGALANVGTRHEGKRVQRVDARGARLADVQTFTNRILALVAAGHRVIVTVDPITDNPSAIPIVRATAGALLVVRAGQSTVAAARSVVDAVGQKRVIGSIFLT